MHSLALVTFAASCSLQSQVYGTHRLVRFSEFGKALQAPPRPSHMEAPQAPPQRYLRTVCV